MVTINAPDELLNDMKEAGSCVPQTSAQIDKDGQM